MICQDFDDNYRLERERQGAFPFSDQRREGLDFNGSGSKQDAAVAAYNPA